MRIEQLSKHSQSDLVKLLPLYPWCKDTATLATMFARDGVGDYWAARLNKSNVTIEEDTVTVRLWTTD